MPRFRLHLRLYQRSIRQLVRRYLKLIALLLPHFAVLDIKQFLYFIRAFGQAVFKVQRLG